MIRLVQQGLVIARRDFMAVVATPTFLIFLLAPFLMLGLSVGSGMGGAYLAKGRQADKEMIVIAPLSDAKRIAAQEEDLRKRLYGSDGGPLPVRIVSPDADQSTQETKLFARKDVEATAVMRGPLDHPMIVHRQGEEQSARYLSLVAEETLRADRLGTTVGQSLSAPRIRSLVQNVPTKSRQQGTGSGAVAIIFILTIMLASQSLGTLAEEKSNKVIEILAAALPLESVFFGKLMGLFGIATVFIAFWGTLAAFGLSIFPATGLASFEPVIGLPLFILFACLYFAMAFMLLGAIFLGIGAQASTMREIQLLSLPATILQLAMFGLGMAAAGNPGSGIATFAQIFPFSSPFAMAARGATDGAIWPHILALGWQGLWVALTITFAAHLFRYGVLKSGVGPFTALRRRLMGRKPA